MLLIRNGGLPLAMDFKEFGRTASIDYSIPPRGTFTAETTGVASIVSTGFAIIIPDDATTDEIGGSAIFRYAVPGVIALEAAVSFSNLLQKKHTLFFDHRNGYASGLALVNPSPTSSMTVLLDFFRNDGSWLMSTSISMSSLGHTSFMLTDEFPQLIGEVGSVEITGQAGTGDTQTGVMVLGLRANPTGPFTTLFPMIPLFEFLNEFQ